MMRIYDGRTEFYQYDTNQKLICDSCKIGEEIHFSNDFYSKAAMCRTYEFEGSIVVDVPNLYLLTSGELLVYLTHIDNDSRSTLKQYTFAVKERKRPSDYVYTETEVLSYHALESKFKDLEDKVVLTEDLETATNAALQKAKDSGEFDGKPGKTPVKGVDYNTPEDRTEMVNAVIKALPNEDVTLMLTDDDSGNVKVSTENGEITFMDDGKGNVIMGER